MLPGVVNWNTNPIGLFGFKPNIFVDTLVTFATCGVGLPVLPIVPVPFRLTKSAKLVSLTIDMSWVPGYGVPSACVIVGDVAFTVVGRYARYI